MHSFNELVKFDAFSAFVGLQSNASFYALFSDVVSSSVPSYTLGLNTIGETIDRSPF